MASRMGAYSTGGAVVTQGSADPRKVTIEGRAVPRAKLGEKGAVWSGEGGFLRRHRGSPGAQDRIDRHGGQRLGDCIRVKGVNGVFICVWGDLSVHHVRLHMVEEEGL